MHHSANCTLYSLSVHLLPMPTLPLPYMPTVSISMSLKQKLPLSQKLGSCDLTISVKDTKLSMISPVERTCARRWNASSARDPHDPSCRRRTGSPRPGGLERHGHGLVAHFAVAVGGEIAEVVLQEIHAPVRKGLRIHKLVVKTGGDSPRRCARPHRSTYRISAPCCEHSHNGLHAVREFFGIGHEQPFSSRCFSATSSRQ